MDEIEQTSELIQLAIYHAGDILMASIGLLGVLKLFKDQIKNFNKK